MRLENGFEVAAPVEAAWRLLNDVPEVVPCMPGAELVEVVDAESWKVKLHVKLGPIALQFAADVRREEMDERAGRVVLAVTAREARGRGGAEAAIESTVGSAGDRTRVDIVTELTLRGTVAQHGRGVVADVASRLTDQFAGCIARKLAAPPAGSVPPGPASSSAPTSTATKPVPIGGLRLLLVALGRSLRGRLPGRRSGS